MPLIVLHRFWEIAFLSLTLATACTTAPESTNSAFSAESAQQTGISFSNTLVSSESINPYTYKSFYNGGGVALGDLDGDGLTDILFAGNQIENRYYRNLGDWHFEDFTAGSGLAGERAWTTGLTLADVDGDGRLDVYLCKSGPPDGANRRNELRINQGDGTFRDVAAEVGLDNLGFSVHAAFLDYDRDGDLDLYLLNNSIRSVGAFDMRPGAREIRDTAGANALYRNELVETGELRFTDVSAAAGIYGSDIGFGLGVTVGDINGDLWPDIYVSNDFFERDYLYINLGDGRFAERLTAMVPETSMGAMGADLADLTGDGRPEIFVTEMLPAGAPRYKSKASFESFDKRALSERQGYHRQYSRNTLLLNEGDGFAEVGRAAGVEATDWSWGALACDLDNDGWRDLYVANGIYKDLLDQDYIRFVADPDNVRRLIAEGGEVITELVDSMPSEPLANYAFRNVGEGLRFVDSAATWGLAQPSFSNGSAYGDLDNDGDLDLVVNTVNQPALVYRNRHRETRDSTNFLRVVLADTLSRANRAAWGSRVRVYAGERTYTAEVTPVRGFMSCVDPRLHFGLGATPRLDSVIVDWSSGGRTVVREVEVNQELHVARTEDTPPSPALGGVLSAMAWDTVAWQHEESDFDDFDRYPLLAEMISAEGPAMALLDVPGQPSLAYFGGARGQAGALFERVGERLQPRPSAVFTDAAASEDVAAVWLDVEGDGDYDLLVAAGGDEASPESFQVRPRLYLNDGGSHFTASPERFSTLNALSCGALVAFDADADGDQDLFFGTHFRLGAYGLPASPALLLNDGSGRFSPAGPEVAGDLSELARVRAAEASDLDGDGSTELVVATEYGPVYVFARTSAGRWTERARSVSGLWRAVASVDLDGDGRRELVAGNLGTNTRLRTTDSIPLRIHIGDFDGNGSAEHLMTGLLGGEESILSLMPDVVARTPALRKRYPRFAQYAAAGPYDIVDTTRREFLLEARELRTGLLTFDGSDRLVFTPLPEPAQRTCIRAIAVREAREGHSPLVYLAGNYARVKPELGGQLSGSGAAFEGAGERTLRYLPGAFPPLRGEVRALGWLGDLLVAARNDAAPLTTAYGPDR